MYHHVPSLISHGGEADRVSLQEAVATNRYVDIDDHLVKFILSLYVKVLPPLQQTA